MDIKIVKRNVKLSSAQTVEYNNAVARKVVHRAHVPNLRFGRIAFTTDADVDG
jgi:DNA gyrase/topoisomerase IV subunit B